MNNDDFNMLFSFPDGSENFVNGFEAGMLYAELQRNDNGDIERIVHAANRELIVRMCDHLRWSAEFTETKYPEWTLVRLKRIICPTLKLV